LAGRVDADYHETFPVGEGASLRLVHGDGDVEVTVWDRPEIDITVKYRAEFRGDGPDPEFEVTLLHEGNSVNAVARETRNWSGPRFRFYRSLEYTWDVKVPAGVDLETRGEDGDVRVKGTRGPLEINGSDGDVILRDVEAPEARIRISDGDVTLVGFRCPRLELRIQDGDVVARELATGRIDVHASDGDVELDFVSGQRLELEVVGSDGDVEVRVPSNVSAEVVLTARDGRVRSDVDARNEEKDRSGYYGILGSGEGHLTVTTSDGGITLRGTR
jgi:hypothetical protein